MFSSRCFHHLIFSWVSKIKSLNFCAFKKSWPQFYSWIWMKISNFSNSFWWGTFNKCLRAWWKHLIHMHKTALIPLNFWAKLVGYPYPQSHSRGFSKGIVSQGFFPTSFISQSPPHLCLGVFSILPKCDTTWSHIFFVLPDFRSFKLRNVPVYISISAW